MPRSRIDPRMLVLLQSSGKTYTLEQGTKHLKLKIEGRFVCALPMGKNHGGGRAQHGCQSENALAAVRRALR